MTDETRQLVARSLKLAGWGTLIGLPVSVYVLRRWGGEEDAIKAAVVLTAAGLVVKHALLQAIPAATHSR